MDAEGKVDLSWNKNTKNPKELGLVQVGLAMLKGCESQLRKRLLQIVSAVALVESITLSDTLQKTDTSYPWKNHVIFSTTLGRDVGQLPGGLYPQHIKPGCVQRFEPARCVAPPANQ